MTPARAQHIAVILHDFSTGGSERIAIRLANRWAQTGRRVTLLCGTEAGAARALVAPGVVVRQCTPATTRSPWSRLLVALRVARLVRSEAPDIVFSPGNFHLVILSILARLHFERRPAYVSKLSNPVRRSGIRRSIETLADTLIRIAARPVDVLVAMSPSLSAEARSVFGRRRVAEIAEPILDDPIAAGARDGRHGRAGGPLILCAARLAPQKNLKLAMRAFAEIPPGLGARLLILGEGPLRRELEAEMRRLRLCGRVQMPGHLADIGPALARADLLLMTSRYEGYPAILVEALAAGVPVVTTDCSLALPEILSSPDLGTIVRSNDPGAIAAAMLRQLGRAGPSMEIVRQVTGRHALDVSARAYLELFDGLAA